jgi:hypothetical protein
LCDGHIAASSGLGGVIVTDLIAGASNSARAIKVRAPRSKEEGWILIGVAATTEPVAAAALVKIIGLGELRGLWQRRVMQNLVRIGDPLIPCEIIVMHPLEVRLERIESILKLE